MSYKVAVASSDGKFVNQHFGRAGQFLIFEIADDQYYFVELRENIPSCDGEEHHENAMEKTIQLIEDCQVVLASQIGPGAIRQLEEKGIKSFGVRDFIDQALEKLISYLH